MDERLIVHQSAAPDERRAAPRHGAFSARHLPRYRRERHAIEDLATRETPKPGRGQRVGDDDEHEQRIILCLPALARLSTARLVGGLQMVAELSGAEA